MDYQPMPLSWKQIVQAAFADAHDLLSGAQYIPVPSSTKDWGSILRYCHHWEQTVPVRYLRVLLKRCIWWIWYIGLVFLVLSVANTVQQLPACDHCAVLLQIRILGQIGRSWQV